MRRRTMGIGLAAAGLVFCSCGFFRTEIAGLPVETRVSFLNLSRTMYAALRIREHGAQAMGAPYAQTPLLAPGAIYIADFQDVVGTGCPGAVDLQVFLYRRVYTEVPIGEDPGEAVEQQPVAAGEILGVPACDAEPLVNYTIVNWDAPEGTARLRIGQESEEVAEAFQDAGLFTDNPDLAWQVFPPIDASLADTPPPSLAENEPLEGTVASGSGAALEGIGVLLRARFRARLDDDSDANDPDSGYGDPIAYAEVDPVTGAFSFDRPPGAYRVEFFSDRCTFRPATLDIQSPLGRLDMVAECDP